MNTRKYLSMFTVAGVMMSQAAFSFEVEHEAHVHGNANLNIAVQNKEVQLAFRSPSMNIVGFEYQPSTQSDKRKVKEAVGKLKQATTLFKFNEAAECEFESVHVSSALLADHDQSEGHDEHDDHKDHDKHDHHDDHKEHDKHDHHDAHADHESVHSEFEVEYHFECAHTEKLEKIDVGFFKLFPSLEEVEAQVVTPKTQKLFELDASKSVVNL